MKNKKNKLHTKMIPPLMMLSAGAIAFFLSLSMGYENRKLLLIVLLTMFIFAVLGTIVKTIVDSFNMHQNYEDFLDAEEEEGEVIKK